MKAYITKYALTKGIFEEEGEVKPNCPDLLIVRVKGKPHFYRGKEWHTSRTDAEERAEAMRARRVEKLKAQLEKLQGLKFSNTRIQI